MRSLSYLNGQSSATVTYTDTRDANVIFDRPDPLDYTFTGTDTTFSVIVGTNIIEIVQPSQTNIRMKVNAGTTQATVTWPIIPAGCTVTQLDTVFTLSGIDSLQDWELVKSPTITLDADFFGTVNYSVEILYDTPTQANKSVRFTVGQYVPAIEMNASASVSCGAGKVVDQEIQLVAQFTTSRLLAILATTAFQNSQFSLTSSAERKFVVLNPATSSITYNTNTNYSLLAQPNILQPNQSAMTLEITPSNTSAISSIVESPPPTISSSTSYNDPTTSSARWGNHRTFAANSSYILIGDEDVLTPSNSVVRLYNLNGTLVRSHTNAEGRVFINSTHYYVQNLNSGTNKLVKISDGTETTVANFRGMTDTHYAYINGSGNAVVEEISTGTLVINNSNDMSAASVVLSNNFATTRNNSTNVYSIFNLSTGSSVRSFLDTALTSAISDDYIALYNTSGVDTLDVYPTNSGSHTLHKSFDMSLPSGYSLVSFNIDISEDGLLTTSERASNGSVYYSRFRIYDLEVKTIEYEDTATGTNQNGQITSGNFITNTKAFNGSYYSDTIESFNITYTNIASIDSGTKVITLTGDRDTINNRLERIEVVPTNGFTSNYLLSFKGTRNDGEVSDIETQSVNHS